MASQNSLLGSGKQEETLKEVVQMSGRVPVLMYNESHMDGILVKDDKKLDEFIKEGWLDHPGKVKRLKGHEKVYDAYQKTLKDTEEPKPKSEPKPDNPFAGVFDEPDKK